jgi:hypothetical protein
MSDNKSARDKKNYPLDVLQRHLDTPQLLPHENAKEFIQLFDSLAEYGKPQTSRDYLAVHQATVLTWDILRYQQMKIGVLRSHQRPALESLLRKIKVRTASKMGISEVVAQSEARELAAPRFKDPASRPAMMRVIENAGYPPDALRSKHSNSHCRLWPPSRAWSCRHRSVWISFWTIWRGPPKPAPGHCAWQQRRPSLPTSPTSRKHR